jgi:hypothetical protein
MKCKACGFDDSAPQERKSWKNPLSFIEVEGHFTTLSDGDGWHPSNRIEISVYACPKCGTLRLSESFTEED